MRLHIDDRALPGTSWDEFTSLRDRNTVRYAIRSSIPTRPGVGRVVRLLWMMLAMLAMAMSVAAETRRVKDGADHVNAYRGPSTRYDLAAILPSGAVVEEVRRVDGWSQILTSDGRVGFVNIGDLVADDTVRKPPERAQADGPDLSIVPQLGHPGQVTDIAFSRDGRLLATASSDRTAWLWDVETGVELKVLRGHWATVSGIAFSPDGRFLATASYDGTTRIWDPVSGRQQIVLVEEWRPFPLLATVSFSPDGRSIVTSTGQTATLWDLETGRALKKLDVIGEYGATSFASSPDGRMIATASGDNGTMRIWDTGTERELRVLEGPGSVIVRTVFSPDARFLATASSDGIARLWDIGTGRLLRRLEVERDHPDEVTDVAFSPDGRLLATTSLEGTSRIWDVETGWHLKVMKGRDLFDTTSVAFSPDGSMIATGHGTAIQTRVSFRLSGSARIWDVAAGRLQKVLGKRSRDVRAVAISPAGRMIANGYGRTIPGATGFLSSGGVRIWDIDGGGRELELGGNWDSVTSVAFSANGRMLAAGLSNSTARIWDLADGGEPRVFGDHSDGVTAVAFSPDGRRLATASGAWDSTARLWDISSGEELKVIEGHSDGIESIAFSPDGRLLATASRDGTARLWDPATGRELKVLEERTTAVIGVSFSPDGHLLATTSWDNTARIWDVATGRQLQVLEGHLTNVYGVAFSPDGRTVATASDTVRTWDVATGRQLKVMEGQSAIVDGIAFSPDGRTVVTASRDNTARIWDAGTGRKLATLIKLVDGSWLQLTPAGFFDGSEDGARNLKLVRGLDPLPFKRISHVLHRPDLVAEAMAGDPEGRYAAAGDGLDLEEAVASRPLPQ